MARWRPWVVISAVTWQRYCANKNGSEKPVSNCWRRVDLPGRVVHRASQGGWSKRLSLMHMGARPPQDDHPDLRVSAAEPIAWRRREEVGEDRLTVRVPGGLAVS